MRELRFTFGEVKVNFRKRKFSDLKIKSECVYVRTNKVLNKIFFVSAKNFLNFAEGET